MQRPIGGAYRALLHARKPILGADGATIGHANSLSLDRTWRLHRPALCAFMSEV
jgi:hypothetical protein